MSTLHFDNIKIAAITGAVPDFVQEINLSPDHPKAAYNAAFSKQTGIRQRHISITEQTGVDLGYVAVKAALEKAGWGAESLDGLFFLTQTPDFNMGTGNAFLLHKHLGLPETAIVFDIAQGCAAFPTGLSVGAAYLQQPTIRRVALVIADVMWAAYADKGSLLNAATFVTGDGAAAVLLERVDSAPPMDLELFSDGAGYHFLYDPWAGTRHAWRKTPGRMPGGAEYHGGHGYMDGMEITAFSTIRVADAIKEFLRARQLDANDFDAVILHQANLQILKAMRKRLKVEPEKFPVIIDRFANTNGASVLLTMVDAFAGQKGDARLLVSAFGIGLSWGIAALTVDKGIIAPLMVTAHRFDEDFLTPLEP